MKLEKSEHARKFIERMRNVLAEEIRKPKKNFGHPARKLVIGGSRHSAQLHAEREGWAPSEWRLVTTKNHVIGYPCVDVYLMHGWMEVRGIEEILQYLVPMLQRDAMNVYLIHDLILGVIKK